VRLFKNILRAIKYNRKKHIPAEEFVRGLEDHWRRPLDPNSRILLRVSPLLVDLLHQMLTGQLVAGDETIDHHVYVVFVDRMFLSTRADPSLLKGKEAFADIWDKFHESHPDAAIIIAHALKAFHRTP
jgi:hypothetical protein